MIGLPDDFLLHSASEWRSGVPTLAQKYYTRWALRPDGPVILGNIAVVQPVRTLDGAAAMLRLAPKSAEFAHDWLALSIWDGDGAARLFDYDPDDGVMLLERLDHTRNLDALPIDEAAAVAGTLRARLSRPAPAGMRTLAGEACCWAQEFAFFTELPKRLTDKAVGLCRELGPGADKFLVNEDQHYHNVLAGEREPWLVIDPMVLAGDREYGLASLVWGRLGESNTERIMSVLIETGNLDPDRTRAWTFVGAMTKWGKSLGRVAGNCAAIAHYLAPLV